ncbi:MAG: MBL fold metallo-hydrolase [Deltaproteobacteria bacterium]|nr:MAG: MBL fold metallo-hydrolase [Deltaproteobacteria bacterium]
MRWPRYLFVIPLVCGAIAAGWIAEQRYSYPDLAPYRRYLLPEAPPGALPIVRWLGATTLLIDDGDTALMTDGFFSRPHGPLRILLGAKIAPDRRRIARALAEARIKRLAAVIVLHSHYDHAMDAPEVARLTGAKLVGSRSTANIGRGWRLPEEQIVVADPGRPMQFGRFRVTLIPSRHAETALGRTMVQGRIEKPLVPPAPALAYRSGESYSLLLEHPCGTMLVQGSAGYRPGALRGRHADIAVLSIGALGLDSERQRLAYYEETVTAVGARLVVPVHWDDFSLPLARMPRPQPRLLDDVERALEFVVERAEHDPGVALRLMPAGPPVALYGLLPEERRRTCAQALNVNP